MASMAKRRLKAYQHQDTVKKISSADKSNSAIGPPSDQIEKKAFKHSSEHCRVHYFLLSSSL